MKTKLLILTVAGALLAAPLANAADDGAQRAQHLVKRGMRQLASEHLKRSQELFAEAARLDPSLPEAIDGLALVAERLGDWRGVADGLEVAERLYRERAVRVLDAQQDATLRLQETQKSFWDMMASFDGAACMAEKDWRRFQPGKELTKDAHMEGFSPAGLPAGLCFRRGVALLHLNRVEEARDEFRRELEASPKTGSVHVNLAVCALRLGEPEAALQELDEGVRLGGHEPDGLREEITTRFRGPSPRQSVR